MRAIILAGGKGTRLRPYTHILPKPLMPLGDKPILEIVIGQLKRHGFDRLTFAVGHQAALIHTYFGDGERFGVKIAYSMETEPLGTAGPLSLVDRPDDDFLVMNGDILTNLDFQALVGAHKASGAIATLAVTTRAVPISLGVLDLGDADAVTRYTEKPTIHYHVSTGIYCFNPRIMTFLEPNQRLDLPDLVRLLITAEEAVKAYRFDGYWLDIGRREDYETAIEAVERGEVAF